MTAKEKRYTEEDMIDFAQFIIDSYFEIDEHVELFYDDLEVLFNEWHKTKLKNQK